MDKLNNEDVYSLQQAFSSTVSLPEPTKMADIYSTGSFLAMVAQTIHNSRPRPSFQDREYKIIDRGDGWKSMVFEDGDFDD